MAGYCVPAYAGGGTATGYWVAVAATGYWISAGVGELPLPRVFRRPVLNRTAMMTTPKTTTPATAPPAMRPTGAHHRMDKSRSVEQKMLRTAKTRGEICQHRRLVRRGVGVDGKDRDAVGRGACLQRTGRKVGLFRRKFISCAQTNGYSFKCRLSSSGLCLRLSDSLARITEEKTRHLVCSSVETNLDSETSPEETKLATSARRGKKDRARPKRPEANRIMRDWLLPRIPFQHPNSNY